MDIRNGVTYRWLSPNGEQVTSRKPSVGRMAAEAKAPSNVGDMLTAARYP